MASDQRRRRGRTLDRGNRDKDYATKVLTCDHEREPAIAADFVQCAQSSRQRRAQPIPLEGH